METMGWGPYQADHEDASGQFEVGTKPFTHHDPLLPITMRALPLARSKYKYWV